MLCEVDHRQRFNGKQVDGWAKMWAMGDKGVLENESNK